MTIEFDLSTEVILNVNTTEDQNDGSDFNGLSLRDAILRANSDPTKNYIINLPTGIYTLTQKNVIQPPTVDDQTLDLETLIASRRATGDLDISSRVTIIGENPENTIIDGSGLLGDFEDPRGRRIGDRIFEVESGGIFNLDNVTIQNGVIRKEIIIDLLADQVLIIPGNTETVQKGGAINIQEGGQATITNSIIADSQSDLEGGGINNDGILELNDSIVIRNQAGSIQVDGTANSTLGGGGIYNTGVMTINRSAIVDNLFVRTGLDISTDSTFIFDSEVIEGGGGGILNEKEATLTIVNSTISGNSTQEEGGGGILSRGSTTVINTTITDNLAGLGSGIWGETVDSNTILINSIVARNKTLVRDDNGDLIPMFDDNNQSFFDKEGNPLPINSDLDLKFYNGDVFLQKSDPFNVNPIENINNLVNVNNLVFNQDGEIVFVFDSENKLIFNENNNFVFAYNELIGDPVYLTISFNEEGDLVFLDPDINAPSDFTENISLIDKNDQFNFDSNNNLVFFDDNLAENLVFVFDENGNQLEDQNVRSYESNPNLIPDIDGFFNSTSSFNLIGSTNGILNEVNSNIAGSISNPIDPKLGPLQNNGGFTPTHALLEGSPALDAGNNVITNFRTFFTSPPTDQQGEPRINNGVVDIGSYEDQFSSSVSNGDTVVNASEVSDALFTNSDNSLLNTPIFRFQNRSQPGTYLYAGEEEKQNINANFRNFVAEGIAFKVGIAPNDDLLPMYRFQNRNVPGTYLYVGEQERQSILQNNRNFVEEGIAFYVYGADSNQGEDIYRFQNRNQPGTYLFVGAQERQNIRTNFPNFIEEGIAFEVSI